MPLSLHITSKHLIQRTVKLLPLLLVTVWPISARDASFPELFIVYHLYNKNLHNTNILSQSRVISTPFLLGNLVYFDFFYLMLPLDNICEFHISLNIQSL